MAYCINCGRKMEDGTKFCPECGTPVYKKENEGKTKRETFYEGNLYKCPNCGEVLNSFTPICPSCGYEIRGSKGTSVVKELSDRINKTKSFEEKRDLISNFYIPNTKEDIIEFFILATSNIEADDPCLEAWYSKLDQTYQKARLLFGSTGDFGYMDQLYKNAIKKKRTRFISSKVQKSTPLKLGICSAIGLIISLVGNFLGSALGNPDSPFYTLAIFGMMIFFIPLFGFIGMLGKYVNKDK